MGEFLFKFLRDDTGAAAAEYALILALICTGIAVAAATLGTNITSAINAAALAI